MKASTYDCLLSVVPFVIIVRFDSNDNNNNKCRESMEAVTLLFGLGRRRNSPMPLSIKGSPVQRWKGRCTQLRGICAFASPSATTAEYASTSSDT